MLAERLNSSSNMNFASGAAGFSSASVDANPSTVLEKVLVAKVARLTNDGSSIGPGSYNVDEASKTIKSSPRGGVKWSNQKSHRMKEHFIKTTTDLSVGPGAYQTTRSIDRSIPNPTIPR